MFVAPPSSRRLHARDVSPHAQDVRPKDVREIGKGGSSAIPRLTEFLKNPRPTCAWKPSSS